LTALVASAGRRRWVFFRRPIEERSAAIGELIRRAGDDEEALKAFGKVWSGLLNEGNSALMMEALHQVRKERAVGTVPYLIWCFSLKSLPGRSDRLREKVAQSVVSLGPQASGHLLRALLADDPTLASWSAITLRRIGLGRTARAIVTSLDSMTPENQQKLLARLAEISTQSWQDIVKLMGGTISLGKAGDRLVDLLIGSLGRRRLEKETLRIWRDTGLAHARIVLETVFEYEGMSLTRDTPEEEGK